MHGIPCKLKTTTLSCKLIQAGLCPTETVYFNLLPDRAFASFLAKNSARAKMRSSCALIAATMSARDGACDDEADDCPAGGMLAWRPVCVKQHIIADVESSLMLQVTMLTVV